MSWLVAVAGWRNVELVRDGVSDRLETFFPLFRERVIKNHKKLWRTRFLFGRYFFVRHRDGIRVDVPGISQVLPSMVCDAEIDGLRRREVKGFVPVPREQRIKRGDT